MSTTYYTGQAADFDELVNQIEAAASLAGWSTTIQDAGSGESAGRQLTLDWGQDFIVTLRSLADAMLPETPGTWENAGGPQISAPGIVIHAVYDSGSEQSMPPVRDSVGITQWQAYNYIGAQPYRRITSEEELTDGWTAPVFPVTYHIFVHTDPDAIVVVVQTDPTRFQWMIFGQLEKFGTWQGGGFYGATGVPKRTSRTFIAQSQPEYSVNGISRNRSYAPFHRVLASFNDASGAFNSSNTRIYCKTGTSEEGRDDYPWTHNATQYFSGDNMLPVREGVANIHWSPLSLRSPNNFNQVSVMLPYWISTQREDHRVLIGRAPHIRHMSIANFNAGDTFELGNEEWMVFPYFEREGLTGLYGWAIRKSAGSS